jgi:biopolymer transport protein ExbB/TolQ
MRSGKLVASVLGGAAVYEVLMLSVSVGLCVWSLVNVAVAVRFHRKAKELLADCRAAVDHSKRVADEVERVSAASDDLRAELERATARSKELHADAVRLLAEADQIARQARDDAGGE